MRYAFDNRSLDTGTRELRCGAAIVAVEPQVFDLLQYLIEHRDRVVTKDELLATVWNGRVVSDSTLGSRITAARQAIGDSGEAQRLIRTVARKGVRFVGAVTQTAPQFSDAAIDSAPSATPAIEPARAERRQLTIVALDTPRPRSASGRMDPEDWRDAVHRDQACVRNVIERAGGFLAHSTSGRMLFFFGFPHAREDDAERAVRAAMQALASVDASRAERGDCDAKARAGMDTGLVVVGDPARALAGLDGAAVGEAPYIAERLLERAPPGALVISDATRSLLGALFEYRDLGVLASAGSAPAVSATQVIGDPQIANRFQALRSLHAKLIGRDEELDLLLRRWDQVRRGEGRVVLLCGEPGIGKSRLVTAFEQRVAPQSLDALSYYCLQYRADAALHPFIAQLERAANFARDDGGRAKVQKIERCLVAAGLPGQSPDVPLMAELLSIPPSDAYEPLSLSPRRRKELVFESFIAQLVARAARGSLLVVCEDVHWIDPTTAELLDIIVERVRDLPVLLILTYRPEFRAPWLGEAHVTALTLTRLSRRDNEALVRQVASGKALPPALIERIVGQTDGVPLFVEEVTKSVLEGGLVREEGGAYVMDAALRDIAVPSTLHASLVARFDRLATARPLVQTAAAVGREFTYPMLQAVSGLTDAELARQLDTIVASGLVHARGSIPHSVYSFKHALVQEAAYATMLRGDRVPIHRRVIEVFETLFPEEATRHPDALAHHCAAAEMWEKAIEFRIRANRTALERSAGIEAQAHVEMAIALLPKIAAAATARQWEGRLQVALGDALTMTRGFAAPEVMTALLRARELLDETAHPIELLRALCGLFNYHLMRSESPLCLGLVEPFVAHEADRSTATVVHYLMGTAHLHLGQFDRSIAHLETALARYDETLCRPVAFVAGYHVRSFTLIWLGLAYVYTGSLTQAGDTITAAVHDARGRSHPFTLVSALLALARFRSQVHDFAGADRATEEGLAIATEQRSPYHLSRGNILRAGNLIDAGRAEEGIALMQRALDAHRATGANFQSSYNLSRLALAYAALGRHDAAIRLADDALSEVNRSGERWWEAEAERCKGEVLLAASQTHQVGAEACFQRALECARAQRAKLWELLAAQSMARLWGDQGRVDEASRLLAPLCEAFNDDATFPVLIRATETLRSLGKRVQPVPSERSA